MCTLIINWNPNSDCPLLVGANRDENPNRVSEPWAFRNVHLPDSNVLCPLDVREGTWIGINQSGVFSALTNLDINEASPGRKSRGDLVMSSLKFAGNAKQSVNIVSKMLLEDIYNPFNLIVISRLFMCVVVGYGHLRKFEVNQLDPGMHIITPDGIDSYSDSRHSNIRDMLLAGNDLKTILKDHSKSPVCIHKSGHITKSSAIIKFEKGWVGAEVLSSDVPPCKDEWNISRIKFA